MEKSLAQRLQVTSLSHNFTILKFSRRSTPLPPPLAKMSPSAYFLPRSSRFLGCRTTTIDLQLDFVWTQAQLISCAHRSGARELQKLIDSTSSPSSPYYRDQTMTTDTTVYPAPGSDGNQLQQNKKRKMDDGSSSSGSANDTQYARYPNLVIANKRMVELHATLKKECEELVSLTVG